MWSVNTIYRDLYNKIRGLYSNKYFYLILFVFALIIKIFYFYVAKQSYAPATDNLYNLFGDQVDYVELCENLHNSGIWGCKNEEGIIVSTAWRMPGFAFIYNPLRLFLSQQSTLNLILIIQVLLSALSCVVVFKIVQRLFSSFSLSIIAFLTFTLSLYTSGLNGLLYAESLAGSSMFFALYLSLKEKPLLSSTLWILVIFLRPFLGVIWFIFIFYHFFINRKKNFIKPCLLYVLPVFIALSVWTIRNYTIYDRFIPLDTTLEYTAYKTKSENKIVELCKVLGFPHIHWENNEHTWFITEQELQKLEKLNVKRAGDDVFDPKIFNSEFSLDSLKKARDLHSKVYDDEISDSLKSIYDKQSAEMFDRFIGIYKSEHWFDAHILSRVKKLCRFLNQPRGSPTMSFLYPFNLILRSIDAFINYLVIILGLCGCLLIVRLSLNNNTVLIYLLCSIPLFIIVFFPILLQADEPRHLYFGYLILTIFSSYLLHKLLTSTKTLQVFTSLVLLSGLLFSLSYHFILYR